MDGYGVCIGYDCPLVKEIVPLQSPELKSGLTTVDCRRYHLVVNNPKSEPAGTGLGI